MRQKLKKVEKNINKIKLILFISYVYYLKKKLINNPDSLDILSALHRKVPLCKLFKFKIKNNKVGLEIDKEFNNIKPTIYIKI
jgi:hypothetical protein